MNLLLELQRDFGIFVNGFVESVQTEEVESTVNLSLAGEFCLSPSPPSRSLSLFLSLSPLSRSLAVSGSHSSCVSYVSSLFMNYTQPLNQSLFLFLAGLELGWEVS